MLQTYKPGLQLLEGQDMEQVNNNLFEVQDNIVAHAGGGFAGAPTLVAGNCRVTTCVSDNDSVALPHAVANPKYGLVNILVANITAHSLNVEPQPADTINAGAAGVAFAVASGKNALFFTTTTGKWYAILSA